MRVKLRKQLSKVISTSVVELRQLEVDRLNFNSNVHIAGVAAVDMVSVRIPVAIIYESTQTLSTTKLVSQVHCRFHSKRTHGYVVNK